MAHWLRPLLIIALALFTAPRVMAADGEVTILCAADGSRQVVLFDFETGAPVEQTVVFETCDHCLTAPMALGPTEAAAPDRNRTWAHDPPLRATHGLSKHTIPAMARAPPVRVI